MIQTDGLTKTHLSCCDATFIHQAKVKDWLTSKSNPLNWSQRRKWMITITACYMSSLISIASSAYSLGIDQMVIEFKSPRLLAISGISFYTLAVGIFPLFLAPLGEAIGRRYVYLISYAIFFIFSLPIALARNIQTVLVSRFICGASGSVGATMVGGTLSDIWSKEERTLPMAMFSLSALFGLAIGPTFFSWTTHDVSWRWIHWTMLIGGAPSAILVMSVFNRETMPIVIRRRKGFDPVDGNKSTKSIWDKAQQALSVSAVRPLEPITTALCIWISFAWACLYLFLESIPLTFAPYGFLPANKTSGLAFSGLAIGSVIGLAISMIFEHFHRTSNGDPEKRLGEACIGGIIFTIGFFWYAWSAKPGEIHWIMPQIGTAIIMAGLFMFYLCIFNYLSDCYGSYTSSAIAAQSFLRNMAATGFPLFAEQMYRGLTYPWASSLLGFLAAILSLVPFILLKYGPKLRSRSPFASQNIDNQ